LEQVEEVNHSATGLSMLKQKLISRSDSEHELFLRRYRTRPSKYQKREPTLFNKPDDS